MDDLGMVLGILRRRRRWSRVTLADRAGVTVASIVALEAGMRSLDADQGGRLIRALVADDPTLYAMAMLCCHTFHAELDRRDAWCQLAHAPVAGCA